MITNTGWFYDLLLANFKEDREEEVTRGGKLYNKRKGRLNFVCITRKFDNRQEFFSLKKKKSVCKAKRSA